VAGSTECSALRSFVDALEPGPLALQRARLSRNLLLRWKESFPELSYAITRGTVDSAGRALASGALSFLRAGREQLLGRPRIAVMR
jgi:hypothetical protein